MICHVSIVTIMETSNVYLYNYRNKLVQLGMMGSTNSEIVTLPKGRKNDIANFKGPQVFLEKGYPSFTKHMG